MPRHAMTGQGRAPKLDGRSIYYFPPPFSQNSAPINSLFLQDANDLMLFSEPINARQKIMSQ